MKKKQFVTIGSAAVLVILLAVVLLRSQGLLAFTDPIGPATQVGVKIYDTGGGVSTKIWSMTNYAECGADIPGYATAPANTLVDTCGNVIPNVQSRICGGNAYKFPQEVYFNPKVGVTPFTGNKPFQHPACVQIIRDFAIKANVNITQVVYVNTTVTETVVNNVVKYTCGDGFVVDNPVDCLGRDKVVTIYVNDTIYMCDGVPTLDPSDCVDEAPVVADEQSLFSRFIEWVKGLFAV